MIVQYITNFHNIFIFHILLFYMCLLDYIYFKIGLGVIYQDIMNREEFVYCILTMLKLILGRITLNRTSNISLATIYLILVL